MNKLGTGAKCEIKVVENEKQVLKSYQQKRDYRENGLLGTFSVFFDKIGYKTYVSNGF